LDAAGVWRSRGVCLHSPGAVRLPVMLRRVARAVQARRRLGKRDRAGMRGNANGLRGEARNSGTEVFVIPRGWMHGGCSHPVKSTKLDNIYL